MLAVRAMNVAGGAVVVAMVVAMVVAVIVLTVRAVNV